MREPYKSKVDACSVENATYRQQYYRDSTVKRAQQMTEDPDMVKRLEACECVVCHTGYGSGRIGGAMITTRLCGVCDAEMRFCSTCTDAVCLSCAKRLGLCKHCGGDIDLKQRRKKRDFSPPPQRAADEQTGNG